jgi:hypothetical protein
MYCMHSVVAQDVGSIVFSYSKPNFWPMQFLGLALNRM